MQTFRNFLHEVNSEFKNNRYYGYEAVEALNNTSFFLISLHETTSQL